MEDFVTFEIAKKLKEKGFNDECHAYYEPLKHCLIFSRVFSTNSLAENYNCVSAPTIEQVLKWLRNNKKTMISILPVAFNEKENKFNKYYCTIYYATKEFVFESHERPDTFETYEECALDAIEYSLDNLI